ncbi:cytochrome b561-like [Acanthaster planci]|uniref:Cytochrome b561-like n=1 Tax=Acanthaster planci TaxID=133434 RepID=A0A8B7YGB3_ACAPL|nr:cytochrome b561-like [Acanthaster planci]XP_022090683.1 cytochrome b561-like [Acanthaster planci]XP_022090684.1 cytochrome b561-like [Acanthaster planci]XP_022090685.1 cytochrome b561-like [Acanthaster planci]XP_022090686.1 cytochrome b561-like [Acanthaster planci]
MVSAFMPLVLLAEAVGLVVVGLVIAWMVVYQDGFALDRSSKEFNLHPVFMVLGLLFLNANALMTYRIIGNFLNRTVVKIIHLILQTLAVVFASFALACVFHFHNASGFANLYSLHSWVGIATFAFFCVQLILGFLAFIIGGYFLPSSTEYLRKVYLHVHVYGGALIFLMAAATSLLGTAEFISFKIKNYSELPAQGVLANVLGGFIVFFVALVCYILYNEKYKASAPQSPPYEQQINIEKD